MPTCSLSTLNEVLLSASRAASMICQRVHMNWMNIRHRDGNQILHTRWLPQAILLLATLGSLNSGEGKQLIQGKLHWSPSIVSHVLLMVEGHLGHFDI